jgi:outer membrane immunogenic protein
VARRLYALIAAFAVISGGASAADLKPMPYKAPPPAPVAGSWTGFYAGVDVGFRSAVVDPSVASARATGPGLPGGFDPLSFCAVAIVPCPGAPSLNNTAFRGGLYGGYNYQIGPRWVVGLEGDVGFADASRTISGEIYPGGVFAFVPIGADSSFSIATKWDASIRARAGILVTPSILAYVTAGPSWMRVEQTSNCGTVSTNSLCSPTNGGNYGPLTTSHAATLLGWTIGGGLEGNVFGNWLARAEYRYADYGTWNTTDTRTCGTGPCFFGFTAVETLSVNTAVKLQTHTAMFGLAYKFGDAPSAAYADAYAADYSAKPFYKAPPAAAFAWTGFHVGADVGLRSAVADATVTSATLTGPGIVGVPGGDLLAPAFCIASLAGTCGTSASLDNTAFRAGLYAGYDYQIAPRWVVGVEGDWGWADESVTISGRDSAATNIVFTAGGANSSYSLSTTWDASLRARGGFLATPSILVYATGGASWLHVESTSACGTTPNAFACGPTLGLNPYGPATITNSDTLLGWTIGGGLEGNVFGNWLARAEYRYADYGTWTTTDVRTCPATGPGCIAGPGITGGPGSALTVNTGIRLQTHTAMFGLGYKF